jgi:hypothetical protein
MPKTSCSAGLICAVVIAAVAAFPRHSTLRAQPPAAQPDERAVERARKMVTMLDQIYKTTIVLITDKYVKTPDDFAAGSAAVLLFDQISKGKTHEVRLLDATGDPYNPDNVARDDFEKTGVQKLKQGAPQHEQVVRSEGRDILRVMTAVPVVMERCTMCHEHYKNAKPGEAIGAISYSVPIE